LAGTIGIHPLQRRLGRFPSVGLAPAVGCQPPANLHIAFDERHGSSAYPAESEDALILLALHSPEGAAMLPLAIPQPAQEASCPLLIVERPDRRHDSRVGAQCVQCIEIAVPPVTQDQALGL